MKLGVALGEYRRPIAAVQTCKNMFPERSENRARAEIVLRATPGLEATTTSLSTGTEGALYRFQDVLYAVSGSTLYSISETDIATEIGTVAGAGRVSIADNGTQMMILLGGTVRFVAQYFMVTGRAITAAYLYDGSTLSQITDPDFPTGDLAEQIYYSNLADGSAWEALDYFSAESNPDPLSTHIVSHGNLLLFGTAQLEYHTPTNDPDLPFQKSQGSEQERGCLAPESVTGLDNTIFFLGDDRVVYKVLDFRPVRVSNHAIEAMLEQASWIDVTRARAFAYTQEGHYFYCLTVAERTWVYDATTSALVQASVWHERTSGDGAWRIRWYAEAYGNKYGLDYEGTIWRVATDVYTDDGDPIPWEFTIGPFTREAENLSCPRLTLVCETGSTTDLDADPQVELSASRDLGRTWYTKGSRSLGTTGEYVRMINWRRNGNSPGATGFTFKFHGERDYEFSVMDVFAELQPG